jgi:hypothetical protein
MTDPQRAERLGWAVAVATLWLLSVGGDADAPIPERPLWDVTARLARAARHRPATRLRLVSLLRRGWVRVMVAVLTGDPVPLPSTCHPAPWADIPHPLMEETRIVEASYEDAA